jgi:hypothetical protein
VQDRSRAVESSRERSKRELKRGPGEVTREREREKHNNTNLERDTSTIKDDPSLRGNGTLRSHGLESRFQHQQTSLDLGMLHKGVNGVVLLGFQTKLLDLGREFPLFCARRTLRVLRATEGPTPHDAVMRWLCWTTLREEVTRNVTNHEIPTHSCLTTKRRERRRHRSRMIKICSANMREVGRGSVRAVGRVGKQRQHGESTIGNSKQEHT